MEISEVQVALTSDNKEKRESAAKEIAQMAQNQKMDSKLFAPLTRLLSDEEQTVQSAASLALFWLADSGVIVEEELPQIITHLRSPDGMIRHDMAGVIESFAKENVWEPSALPLLEGNLDHENPHTRAATIYCMGTLNKKGYAGVDQMAKVERALNDEDAGVRQAAQRVMG